MFSFDISFSVVDQVFVHLSLPLLCCWFSSNIGHPLAICAWVQKKAILIKIQRWCGFSLSLLTSFSLTIPWIVSLTCADRQCMFLERLPFRVYRQRGKMETLFESTTLIPLPVCTLLAIWYCNFSQQIKGFNVLTLWAQEQLLIHLGCNRCSRSTLGPKRQWKFLFILLEANLTEIWTVSEWPNWGYTGYIAIRGRHETF